VAERRRSRRVAAVGLIARGQLPRRRASPIGVRS
jgi:hypothetical protein